ncbi:MAG: sugar phosphate isomerase/epimerase [Clostridia bacterium]|nr:sugar phosphate isomerase/epimerase [Clostridia bacterium]
MRRVGYSVYGKDRLNDELAMRMSDNGVRIVELDMAAEDYPNANFHETAEIAKRYGMEIASIHLPIAPQHIYDVTHKYATVGAVPFQIELIKRGCEILGVKHIVIHSGGEPLQEAEREERVQRAGEKLPLLADVAEKYGADICIEVLPRTCLGRDSDEILAMLAYDDRLRVCLDTNHIFRESEVDFIRKLGKKIATTHISDRDHINERHWLPGEGILDWVGIIDALDEIGYEGDWIYECGLGIPKTILRERPLTFADIYRNAQEIFARQKPTVFAKPKPGVGMWE